ASQFPAKPYATRRGPVLRSAAHPTICCKPHSPAPTDAETTTAAVRTTVADRLHAPRAPAGAPLSDLLRVHGVGALPVPLPSALQTTPATATPLRTRYTPATSPAWPAASVRPIQRSSAPFPPSPASTPRQRFHLEFLLPHLAGSPDLRLRLPTAPAPATPYDQSCRWSSTAKPPA